MKRSRHPAALPSIGVALLTAAAFAGPDVDEGTSVRPDAGSTVRSAKVCKGEGTVNSATGELSVGALTGDAVDLFLVQVTNPATFTATVAAAVPANLDTQLFLFRIANDATGAPVNALAVAGNNDQSATDRTSKVWFPAGTQYAPGTYALAVTVSGVRPYTYQVGANGNRTLQEMFTTAQTGLMLPTGAGLELPLRAWSGQQSAAGSYRISFTGASFIPLSAGDGACGNVFAGSCFQQHAPRACDDAACCGIVCGIDPFCCTTTWDGNCVEVAYQNCLTCTGGVPDPCPSDLNHDGVVNGADLGQVLGTWGPCN